jgi:uncharacterized protein YbaP (TraB family)
MKGFAVALLFASTFLIGAQAQEPPATTPPPVAPITRAPSAHGAANPALWKVVGKHATVYLFGSVHVMKPDVQWETDKVKAALHASDVLYLEIADLDPARARELQPEILKLGMDMDHPLSTKISAGDIALINTALKSFNVPGVPDESMLEPMRPWMVYMMLSVLPSMKAGYQSDSGIDMKMLAESKTENKPVKGFETMQQQVHFLADFPEKEQVELLHQTLVDLPRSATQTDEMVEDWEHGEVDKIAAMENDDMKAKYPGLYEKLLVQRNQHFTDVLAGILNDPSAGTVFVTVGAAHLAGPDSVQNMLKKQGFNSVRVE